MNSKLCIIYDTAPHYREAIFKSIDMEYDCIWLFGKTTTDIKEMDLSQLKDVHYYKTYGSPNKLYWQGKMISSFLNKKYDALFMLVSVRSLSVWMTLLLKAIFRPQKKIYGWSHGWYGREGKLRKKFDLWKGNIMDGWFVYNQKSKDLMVQAGMSPDKIHVIANSLDYHNQIKIRQDLKLSSLYKDHFGNNNPTIIFIGRLTSVKRLDMLIKAIHKIPDVNLVLVGGGEQQHNLEQIVDHLKIQKRVWFYGPCYDDKKNAELIFNADLCVAPGNVGLTAMHSMVFGTPVISHNDFSWQMPEFEAIRKGQTGDFFERNNVVSLVEKITKWLSGPGKEREKTRQNCYNEIDTKWNPDYQIKIIKKYIEEGQKSNISL